MGKTFNRLMKVIHSIEGDYKKVIIAPWKSKQPNMEVLKYIKGGTCSETEVGKYRYTVIEGKNREGRPYVRIQLSIADDVTWDDWYSTLRGSWRKKGEKQLRICSSDFVDPLWFGWIRRNTW